MARALFEYADLVRALSYYYGGSGSGAQIAGLVYLAAGIAAFVAAWGFWSMRPWAWPLGIVLAGIAVASAFLSLINNGSVAGIVINLAINAAILFYLNTNEIRPLFGRSPSTFMQPQSRR